MKASLLTAIVLSMCVPCWAQENKAPIETTHWRIAFPLTTSSKNPAPKTATAQQIIPDGTVVSVSLNTAIRSDEFRAGQQVALTVNEPVILNGLTMIKSGTQAMAHVEQVDKAGVWAKGGKIAWVIDDVLAVNGARVPLRFSDEVKGDNSTGVMVTGGAVGNFFVGPLGLLLGIKRGKQAVIPAGEVFKVYVNGDTPLTSNAATMTLPQQSPPAAPTSKPAKKTTCLFGGQEIPC